MGQFISAPINTFRLIWVSSSNAREFLQTLSLVLSNDCISTWRRIMRVFSVAADPLGLNDSDEDEPLSVKRKNSFSEGGQAKRPRLCRSVIFTSPKKVLATLAESPTEQTTLIQTLICTLNQAANNSEDFEYPVFITAEDAEITCNYTGLIKSIIASSNSLRELFEGQQIDVILASNTAIQQCIDQVKNLE